MPGFKCSKCKKPIVWARLAGKLITLDAKAEKRFTLHWSQGDDKDAELEETYQKHKCPKVPR